MILLNNIFDYRTHGKIIDVYQYLDFVFDGIHDSKFKGAIYMHIDKLYFAAEKSRGHIFQRLIKERIVEPMYGMRFPKNHKFYEIFDRKLQQIFEAGVSDRYVRELNDRHQKRYSHLYHDGPEVLTMEHLEAGFVVCLKPLLFACIAFVFEWIIRVVEFVICKSIFKAFFQRQMWSTFRIANFYRNPSKLEAEEHQPEQELGDEPTSENRNELDTEVKVEDLVEDLVEDSVDSP